MSDDNLSDYFEEENLHSRVFWLREFGNSSNVWREERNTKKEWVVEVVDSVYVSKPCWKEINYKADRIENYTLDLNMFCTLEDKTDFAEIYQFFFSEIELAESMALRVRNSAREKRKEFYRKFRLEKAGGFHTKEIIEQLFKIQEGRCYYSGEPLNLDPKNFDVDHIKSTYKGGTDWPENLALAIKKVNVWKGAHYTALETLNWLAERKGTDWLKEQKKFCRKVDRQRKELDKNFKMNHKQI